MLGKVKTLFRFSTHRTTIKTVTSGGYDQELDTRGWNCPVPVMKVKKALDELKAGQVLHVITTDPGSLVNLRGLSNQPGITLLESSEAGEEYHFVLKRDEMA